MITKEYETRTVFLNRKNATAKGYWGEAIDIGYSAVKGFSPNAVYAFPSFARKASGQMLSVGEPDPNDIQYRDENGVIWNVGQSAITGIASGDSNDSVNSLFGRNRYFAPMFLVLARVGIGIGMMENEFGNPNDKELVLQTGLPPAYLKEDAKYIKEVLSGRHQFQLRVGARDWQEFTFVLPESNIRVMQQPMGSLLSAALNNNCQQVADAARYFASNVLVLDAGFGTVDTFDVKHRQIESSESFDDLGMKEVLARTSTKLFDKFHTDIPVHAMQKCLHNGCIQTFDRKTMTTNDEPFDEILESCSEEVCDEMLERIKTMYNNLLDYDYLIVTGGTGAAWLQRICNHFNGMKSLKVVGANQNDDLSHIFSNVRGYYLFQIGALKQRNIEEESNTESEEQGES